VDGLAAWARARAVLGRACCARRPPGRRDAAAARGPAGASVSTAGSRHRRRRRAPPRTAGTGTWRPRSGPPRDGYAALAFPYENPFCMRLLYGRAGRLTAQNGGFRPGQERVEGPATRVLRELATPRSARGPAGDEGGGGGVLSTTIQPPCGLLTRRRALCRRAGPASARSFTFRSRTGTAIKPVRLHASLVWSLGVRVFRVVCCVLCVS
jgi:hypothetical protein